MVDVEGQNGRLTHAYFRFYDPVVLRTFLPTATPRQMEDFFGPISAFYVEGEHGELCSFAAKGREEAS